MTQSDIFSVFNAYSFSEIRTHSRDNLDALETLPKVIPCVSEPDDYPNSNFRWYLMHVVEGLDDVPLRTSKRVTVDKYGNNQFFIYQI